MRRREKKDGRTVSRIIICILLAIVLLEGSLVVYKRSDWRFLAKEAAAGLFRKSGMEEASDLTVQEWSIEELLAAGVVENDSLLLINEEYPVSSDYSESVEEYKATGVKMNICVIPSYDALAAEVKRKFDERLYISSSYRTAKKQEEVLATSAKNVAAKVGASEHQAGLALDIYFDGYAGRAVLKCEAGRFVNANCYQYGFVVRYPLGQTGITGTAFESWHLRYVGAPHAEIMYLDGIVLEEYMELLSEADYYRYKEYLITRQKTEPFFLPEEFKSGVISKDNTGAYIITLKLQ